MKNQFVTYEIALKLKELGFDELCLAVYRDLFDDFGVTLISKNIKIKGNQSSTLYWQSDNNIICIAPLWQQVIDWLREKHDILIYVSSSKKDKHLYQLISYDSVELSDVSEWIDSYEKAREQAISKALTLIK